MEMKAWEEADVQGVKKRKGPVGEGIPIEKGGKLSGNLSIVSGSGMAEAVGQPRQPL